jgi:hypothetical protein
MTCPVCPMTDQAYSYRPDLYYVQTRFRSASGHNVFHRERVVGAFAYYARYRWQVMRFRRMKQFNVLVQREWWPVFRVDQQRKRTGEWANQSRRRG